ncbi:MAG: hypothetical protein EB023_11005 [Flavobacteriia bacterium]|nr:hypothetical protein [Flavobacteriia bacterium]
MICTKKQLMKRLSSVEDNEKMLVLFWEKGEFDNDIEGRDLTSHEWNKILSNVYTDGADEEISNQISDAVADIACKVEEKLEKKKGNYNE